MTVIYPKEYMSKLLNNYSEVEFISSEDVIPHPSGMLDTFLMVVEHQSGMADLNYELSFCNKSNRHTIKTSIDCNFYSGNLELLIKKFKTVEDIWNYER
jgi:hypothetical protein